MALSKKHLPVTGSPLATVTAKFPARAEGLAELHEAFDRFFVAAERAGASISVKDRVAMVTAAAEIAANIVAYACRKIPDAHVLVALCRQRDSIETRFEDPGIPCEERDPNRIDEVPHLGIGITIARASVDTLEYAREDGTNHWRLVRLTEAA